MTSDFQLRICDFGSSTFSQNSSQISKWQEIKSPLSAVGSPEYNAPEIIYDSIEHDKFSLEQADVFSLACAMFLMVIYTTPSFKT
jgi:serine/threonine protein kinase